MWVVLVRVEHFIGPHTTAESLVSRRKAGRAVLSTEAWPLLPARLSLYWPHKPEEFEMYPRGRSDYKRILTTSQVSEDNFFFSFCVLISGWTSHEPT